MTTTGLTVESAAAFERTIAENGIAIFPTDTLYGIACDPDSQTAADRIYELKGRPPRKPSAVMYFSVERMLGELGEGLDERTRGLIAELLPGPFTLVVANPARRFAPACADTPEKLGLRVPKLEGYLAPLAGVSVRVMQTSANLSGAPDATALEDIDPAIVKGVDLALDGGPLLGYGSTVADVSELEEGRWRLLRSPMPRTSGRLTELIGIPPAD
ncbi:MAG: L-threonylcarbamoyladenylate synthase [Solirubrobacterales bacterium]